EAGTVSLRMSAERGSAWPPELKLRVIHATIASLDREYRLEHVGDGRYRAAGEPPQTGAGRWLVQLEDAGRTWRLVAASVTRFDVRIALQAGTPSAPPPARSAPPTRRPTTTIACGPRVRSPGSSCRCCGRRS